MTAAEIVTYPDPVLKKASCEVLLVGEEERRLLDRMLEIMRATRSIGLAAPQIGINRNLAVVDVGKGAPLKMINPVILEKNGSRIKEEGCLSLPNLYVNVKRAEHLKVRYLNESGKETITQASNLMARVILHEIDHLRGKLISDHMNPIERFFKTRSLKGR